MQTDPVCKNCLYHLSGNRCFAFPSGIPDEIWNGANDHSKPYEGDHGIQFKEDTLEQLQQLEEDLAAQQLEEQTQEQE